MYQTVCDHHEWIEAGYKDTAGNSSTITQCRKCGQIFDQIPVPTPSEGAVERKEEGLEDIAKRFQKECHNTVKIITSNSDNPSDIECQDAINVFLYRKLAELQFQINQLQTPNHV